MSASVFLVSIQKRSDVLKTFVCKVLIMGIYTHNVYIQSIHFLREGGQDYMYIVIFTHVRQLIPIFFMIGLGVYIYRPTCSIHLGNQSK